MHSPRCASAPDRHPPREQALQPGWRRPQGRGSPSALGFSSVGSDRELIPEKDDVTMSKYFTPPIVVPLALVRLVVIAALVRM